MLERCLRLQRGCRVRGWGRTYWGRGRRRGGSEGAEGVYFDFLLRNCTLEHLAGFVIDECEAEIGGALAQAANDARAVLGVVRGGPWILVHQTILEGAVDEDRQLTG